MLISQMKSMLRKRMKSLPRREKNISRWKRYVLTRESGIPQLPHTKILQKRREKTRARRGTETQKGVKLERKSTVGMRADTPLALGSAAERLKAVLEKLVELEEFGEPELDAKKNKKHDHSHCQVALS